MKNILKNIKGKFILSLNDNKEIIELFNDFRITRIKVNVYSNIKDGIGGNDRNELLIMNF
jgi:DNA adenine methylase